MKQYPYNPDWEIQQLCFDKGYFHLIVKSLDSNKIYYWAVRDLTNWRYIFDKCRVVTNESFNRDYFNTK
jgi:hypothetical protein